VAMTFANTLPWALAYGKTFVKVGWDKGHFKSWSVMPYEIGVYRDDIPNIQDQECYVQTYYTNVHQLRRSLKGHLKEKDILKAVEVSLSTKEGGFAGDGWHKIFLTGTQPIITNAATPRPCRYDAASGELADHQHFTDGRARSREDARAMGMG